MAQWEKRLDDFLNHRLSFKTFAKEVFAHFTDKVIPHGADEIGNVLFSSSAYLPWPGMGGPKPIPAPEPEPEPPQPTSFDEMAALYGVSYGPDRNDGMDR